MNKADLIQGLAGILELVAMGSAHEIDQDEELASLVDGATVEDGNLVIVVADGTRWALSAVPA